MIKEDFIHDPIYIGCSSEIQKIFLSLFDMLDKDEINYDIRLRKDNSIVLSLKESDTKNIFTILIYQKHLKVKIYKVCDTNLYSPDDINDSLRNAILNKYYEINKDKKQISIYLDNNLIKKVEKKSKENNEKLNDFVVKALQDKLNTIFLNEKHKYEFSVLLKNSGIYRDSNDYSKGLPDDLRKKVMFFYLVSAYQDNYRERYGSSFVWDKKNKVMLGPEDLDLNWKQDFHDECALAYGLTVLLIYYSSPKPHEGVENPMYTLLQILQEGHKDIYKLFINGIKLLNGDYTINKDEIVEKEIIRIYFD